MFVTWVGPWTRTTPPLPVRNVIGVVGDHVPPRSPLTVWDCIWSHVPRSKPMSVAMQDHTATEPSGPTFAPIAVGHVGCTLPLVPPPPR